MICKLEIYNGELNIFPVVTNERLFAQITMSNIVEITLVQLINKPHYQQTKGESWLGNW